eukprot:TRINITY_DN2837_c0_g1_i1.p1 TRINITY_DN2837_c0_g1~~TRINITY_DN2837_c0_g1_i1.p1  ORF type:complete len:101 (+),score=4.52 TRINITY_DN2837_c0_g1_i1:392-694(+)
MSIGRSPRSPLKLGSPSVSQLSIPRKQTAAHLSDSEGEEWNDSSEFYGSMTDLKAPRSIDSYETEIARLKQQLAAEAEARRAAEAEARALSERLARYELR